MALRRSRTDGAVVTCDIVKVVDTVCLQSSGSRHDIQPLQRVVCGTADGLLVNNIISRELVKHTKSYKLNSFKSHYPTDIAYIQFAELLSK